MKVTVHVYNKTTQKKSSKQILLNVEDTIKAVKEQLKQGLSDDENILHIIFRGKVVNETKFEGCIFAEGEQPDHDPENTVRSMNIENGAELTIVTEQTQ